MSTVSDGEAVQMLLDGLRVESLVELKQLVDDGRYYQFMRSEGFELREPQEGRGNVTAP